MQQVSLVDVYKTFLMTPLMKGVEDEIKVPALASKAMRLHIWRCGLIGTLSLERRQNITLVEPHGYCCRTVLETGTCSGLSTGDSTQQRPLQVSEKSSDGTFMLRYPITNLELGVTPGSEIGAG